MTSIRSLALRARHLRGRLAVLGLALAVVGCDNTAEPKGGATAASLEFVVDNGAASRAEAGTALEIPPGVRAKDQAGNPVKGVSVTFTTNSGTLVGATRVTGDDGIARPFGWNLGSESGNRTLTATAAGGVTATYTLRVRAQPAARIVGVAGLTQSGVTGGPTPVPPTVRVVDVFNNPVAGVTVTFTVTSGNGSVSPATVTTDSAGIATTNWTLGLSTGTNTVRASIANLASVAPVTFTATATVPSGSMQIVAGNNQSAPALSMVPVAPAVRVVDDAGLPQAGVSVTFKVLTGNGAVGDARTTTDANGVARAGGWALGPTGSNTLQAYVTSAPALSVTFTATTTTTAPFAITYRFVVDTNSSASFPPTRRQLEAFVASNQRWARAITGDLSNESMNVNANTCGNHPAVNESVDDVLIFVELVDIDGPGQVLGSAGPCFIRETGLPILGRIRLDLADLDRMVTNGTIDDVVTHEIGHVLGVGSLWNLCINANGQFTTTDTNCSQVIFRLRTGTGGENPEFTGTGAKNGYANLGGPAGSNVPVENTGGQGTRDSHWRETTFFNELMTGFVQSGRTNPMSQITVGSLGDMGYAASNAGVEAYALPTTSAVAAEWFAKNQGTVMNDVVEKPRFVVRRDGRVEPVLGGPTTGAPLKPQR